MNEAAGRVQALLEIPAPRFRDRAGLDHCDDRPDEELDEPEQASIRDDDAHCARHAGRDQGIDRVPGLTVLAP
jgi:hypothetical protein